MFLPPERSITLRLSAEHLCIVSRYRRLRVTSGAALYCACDQVEALRVALGARDAFGLVAFRLGADARRVAARFGTTLLA